MPAPVLHYCWMKHSSTFIPTSDGAAFNELSIDPVTERTLPAKTSTTLAPPPLPATERFGFLFGLQKVNKLCQIQLVLRELCL